MRKARPSNVTRPWMAYDSVIGVEKGTRGSRRSKHMPVRFEPAEAMSPLSRRNRRDEPQAAANSIQSIMLTNSIKPVSKSGMNRRCYTACINALRSLPQLQSYPIENSGEHGLITPILRFRQRSGTILPSSPTLRRKQSGVSFQARSKSAPKDLRERLEVSARTRNQEALMPFEQGRLNCSP